MSDPRLPRSFNLSDLTPPSEGQPCRRQILVPFDKREAITPMIAAGIAGVTDETIRNRWCAVYGIGRKVGSRWLVSRVALIMHIEGDRAALRAYHDGDRSSDLVRQYYARAGVPLPAGGAHG